jgi:hypothetical protein
MTIHVLPTAVKLSPSEIKSLNEEGFEVEITIDIPAGVYFVVGKTTDGGGRVERHHLMADQIKNALL